MPISEMQARLFFHVLSGRARLPGRQEMLKEIEDKRDEMAKRYVESMRHTIQVGSCDRR